MLILTERQQAIKKALQDGLEESEDVDELAVLIDQRVAAYDSSQSRPK